VNGKICLNYFCREREFDYDDDESKIYDIDDERLMSGESDNDESEVCGSG